MVQSGLRWRGVRLNWCWRCLHVRRWLLHQLLYLLVRFFFKKAVNSCLSFLDFKLFTDFHIGSVKSVAKKVAGLFSDFLNWLGCEQFYILHGERLGELRDEGSQLVADLQVAVADVKSALAAEFNFRLLALFRGFEEDEKFELKQRRFANIAPPFERMHRSSIC